MLLVRFAFVTVDPVENAYRSEEDVDEVRRLTRSIRLQNEWNRSIVWNFPARHLRRERRTLERTAESFLSLTLSPNTFRRLIVATENIFVPMAEDFVHNASRRIFDITSDVVQSRSIITLNETKRESIGEPPASRSYLNETDARLRSRRTLHQHITVMVDPTFSWENIVNTHRALIPGDRLVVFSEE